jgi:hypothetical protein
MTIIARTFIAIPSRSASETWEAIINLLAPAETAARKELKLITGIACSLITREAMKSAPIVIHGCGPQLRFYCIYHEDAITGDSANEGQLTFNPTAGEWAMSLPCPKEEMEWVQGSLLKKTKRITARDQEEQFESGNQEKSSDANVTLDKEAFFRL